VGIEPVHGKGIGLPGQRGYMTCPWDKGPVPFDLSLSQWDMFGTGSVPAPCACTTWYRACLYQVVQAPCLYHPLKVCTSSSSKPQRVPNQIFRNSKRVLIEFREKHRRGSNRISEIWERIGGTTKWDGLAKVGVRGKGGTGTGGSPY